MIGVDEKMSGVQTLLKRLQLGPDGLQPDFRKRSSEFFPPEVVKGFSASERRALGDGIANALQIFELRSFKSIGNYKLQKFNFICSRSGAPGPQGVKLRNTISLRVGCKASFFVDDEGVTFNLHHCSECEPDKPKDLEVDVRHFASKLHAFSPTLETDIVDEVLSNWKGDYSLRKRNLRLFAEQKLKERGFVDPPENFLVSVVERAIFNYSKFRKEASTYCLRFI